MISYKDAYALIENEFYNLPIEVEVVEIENAVNRTLAENIIADVNLPPFDNSAVDGLAIKYDENDCEWEISNEVSAGNFSEMLESDSVIIMTGAKVPPHFDTVIPLEDYSISHNIAKLNRDIIIKKGQNIRRMASDIAEMEVVLNKNTFLTPRNISAIAACGKSKVLVYKKLNFAVLATGDELISIDQKPINDKIRVSNNYGILAAVEQSYQVGINYGFINDNYEATKKSIFKLLESDADIIITTGGVSVGKFDYVKEIFEELGVEEIFWRSNIKPGKPIFFGKHLKGSKTQLVFGLPGNPVSCLVNYDVFVKPNTITKYGMDKQIRVKAELKNDVRKNDGKKHFVRGRINRENDKYLVTSNFSQSSGNLVGFSQSNCLIELVEDVRNPLKGDIVECILI